ncbi:MAG: DUF4126 family protein [Solirubrobacterales bacterium]|nr:DUF4126 family protein [Solirubrobacterales bacterium]
MDLFLAICQGAGLAAAAGIRPFLPVLVAGIAARADLLVNFEGTDYAFLEAGPFLLAVVVVMIFTVVAERRIGSQAFERGPLAAAVSGIALGFGALLFAGSLAEGGWSSSLALVAGFFCAGLAQFVARPLLARVRARLAGDEAAAAVSFYADGVSLVLAILVVAAPPLAIPLLIALAWLAITGSRGDSGKHAGLRILR